MLCAIVVTSASTSSTSYSQPRVRARVDLVTFVFFLIYAGTLTVVGAQMAWTSFQQSETTGRPGIRRSGR